MSRASKVFWIFLIFGLTIVSSAQLRIDSDRLLDEVLKANGTLRFRGLRSVTFRSMREGQRQERKIIELIVRDGNKSRTEYSGDESVAGQIAVDDGINRYQYLPKDNIINKMPSLQTQTGGRLEFMFQLRRKEFKVLVREGGKVADLPTLQIEMVGNTGQIHRIWVEKHGKAILKREMSGGEPDRGMSYEFQTFAYQASVPHSEFVINKPGAKVIDPLDRLMSAAKKIGVEPYTIKSQSGFVLFDARGFQRDDKSVLRSSYGNGRTLISLVQVRGELNQERLLGQGERKVRFYIWSDSPYNFAILGDLPPEELTRLAGFVRR